MWNVGSFSIDGKKKWATTNYWLEGKQAAEKAGILYAPVVYPGFSWSNLKRNRSLRNQVPREGGLFFWRQFHEAVRLGFDTVYVAMFDEVDEGTAVFKVTNNPRSQAWFATYDGKPSDWYLRLAGAGRRMLLGEIPLSDTIPIQP